jgi:hypothetical protein
MNAQAQKAHGVTAAASPSHLCSEPSRETSSQLPVARGPSHNEQKVELGPSATARVKSASLKAAEYRAMKMQQKGSDVLGGGSSAERGSTPTKKLTSEDGQVSGELTGAAEILTASQDIYAGRRRTFHSEDGT